MRHTGQRKLPSRALQYHARLLFIIRRLDTVGLGSSYITQRELTEVVAHLTFGAIEGGEVVHHWDRQTRNQQHEVHELKHDLEVAIDAKAKQQKRILFNDQV